MLIMMMMMMMMMITIIITVIISSNVDLLPCAPAGGAQPGSCSRPGEGN